MRNKSADGLRGIAALNVTVHHFLAAFLPTALYKNYPFIFSDVGAKVTSRHDKHMVSLLSYRYIERPGVAVGNALINRLERHHKPHNGL
jgi:peptidoglycan/LPS O-acetylase OafA/YrhL